MREIKFLKLHGLGNDFVLVDERKKRLIPESRKREFSIRFCERHVGIGADGVLFLGQHGGQVTLRIFNADGSEAEMCVNGVRCAALALRLRLDYGGGPEVEMRTKGGVVRAKVLSLTSDLEGVVQVQTYFTPRYLGRKMVDAGGRILEYHLVDVGNPHAVTFLEEDVGEFDVEGVGHSLELHDVFQPEGVNAEFVNVVARGRLRMRVHERGVCETLACGSGAIAAATAAGWLNPERKMWVVEMPGGSLEVETGQNTSLIGPATVAFEGRLWF